MAAFLRPAATVTRALLRPHRLISQPVHLSRPLCKVPPEHTETDPKAKDNDKTDAKAKDDTTTDQAENTSLKSQDTETQTETLKASPEEAREGVEADGRQESSVASGSGEKKQSKPGHKRLNDLLMSLASASPIPEEPVESAVQLSRPQKQKKKARPQTPATPQQPSEPELEPELVSATKEVAESLGGDHKETESELLSALRLHSTETSARAAPSLSELFVGMKVERKPTEEKAEASSSPQFPYGRDRRPSQRGSPRDSRQPRRGPGRTGETSAARNRVDLFGSRPLGIFTKRQEGDSPPRPAAPESVLPTWDKLHHCRLQDAIEHPPANAFVEMIQWTNQGKLWPFPIDNEMGLEEEKKVGFHEHVFLEGHLEGWCPQRGPVRHFMELVCTGLSKNPYLTVQRKQAHIEWYKNYFSQKEELLRELGAIEASQ